MVSVHLILRTCPAFAAESGRRARSERPIVGDHEPASPQMSDYRALTIDYRAVSAWGVDGVPSVRAYAFALTYPTTTDTTRRRG